MLDTATHPRLTVRTASDADAYALAQLAAVDSSRPLAGRTLVAEVDSEPVAAISVDDGKVVADPFRRTAEVVEMLRLRVAQMQPGRGLSLRPRPSRAPRPVPAH
jgi:hypothetical protein